MKKTRFFYGIFVILLWILLLDTAYAMNTEKEEPLIRVLIMDSGYQSYYHQSVSLTWQGQEYVFDGETCGEEELSCMFEGGREGIQISSVQREQGTPIYRGSLKITKKPEGFLIVNTLPLETYLEAVVPSEMPSSYPAEALKAQAVCARTYAWKQIKEKKLESYGADVDDSVNYQVYNNIGPEESTTQAVKETEGKILSQNGKPIEAYYFSTSAGVTSTDEIWGAESSAPYLKSVDCSFDSEEPWRTWETEISRENVEQRAQRIEGCEGSLTGLEVTGKSESGAVTRLRVHTEGGDGEVANEYEIRSFLAPDREIFAGKEKEKKNGGSLLPSAYFSLEETEKGFFIRGGGYGHGVGMSQTAAGKMAEEGYTWEEILMYFFREIEISRTW
ncbi:MAG: SpoIID/LytB domain-containing protein [Blautia sp.]